MNKKISIPSKQSITSSFKKEKGYAIRPDNSPNWVKDENGFWYWDDQVAIETELDINYKDKK